MLFFLQFAEFNLKAPPYLKTLHFSRISISRALPPFRTIYNRDRTNFLLLKCSPWKIQNFHFILNFSFYSWGRYYSRRNLFSASRHSEEPLRVSCPLRKVGRASWFFHIFVQINVSSTINMQTKGSIKSLQCRGLLLSFYELMNLGVLSKWTLKWLLNQKVIFLILILLSCPCEFSFFWAV